MMFGTPTKVAIAAIALAAACSARDKERIQIQVVDSAQSEREVVYNLPARAGQSNTSCTGYGSATSVGPTTTANGAANCNTVSTPGSPARTVTGRVGQTQVRAIMPDGRHVTLGCQQGGNGGFNWAGAMTGNPAAHFGHGCPNLEAGTFEASIDGNNVTVYGHDLGGKEHKLKFLYTGTW